MIPNNIVQEMLHRSDVVEVVGQFLTLKKEGSRYISCCPFHDERTPSFYVTPAMQMFKCFGCGAGGDTVAFLMKFNQLTYVDALKWLAGFYHISIDGEIKREYQPPQRRDNKTAPILPPSFTDPTIFQKSLSGYILNNLVQWLCARLGRTVVMEAVNEYRIGTTKGGATIFWQVNNEGQAGTGHIIAYPKDDHHRIKTIPPNWVHSVNCWNDTTKYNWVKYWFGEHLLSMYPTSTVAIVESEKTALICSIYFKQYNFVWLASCGKDGINSPEKWNVLKGRTVVLYPDLSPPDEKGRTPFQAWSNKAAELVKQGFSVSVNEFLENHADEFERAQKWDLADFLLLRDLGEFQNEQNTLKTTENAPQLPTTNIKPLNVLPCGYKKERYQHSTTGETWEILINADGYPANWDLTNN